MKRYELLTYAMTWMKLKNVMLSEKKPDTQNTNTV